jgi:excisionase family DNA binding protein
MGSAPLLRPAEVAARLGVSRAWLYAAAQGGRIPSVRLGDDKGPLRFVEEDVEQWLERARTARGPTNLRSVAGDGGGGLRSRRE